MWQHGWYRFIRKQFIEKKQWNKSEKQIIGAKISKKTDTVERAKPIIFHFQPNFKPKFKPNLNQKF